MRAFLTTVAGMATRFCADLPQPVPKCIYTAGDPAHTLLYRMLTLAKDFDRLVIVGGFRFDEIRAYAAAQLPAEIRAKLLFAENPQYAEYGSGWSLYVGLKALLDAEPDCQEILFAEGDLYYSAEEFAQIAAAEGDVLTTCCEPIRAEKAVALYYDLQGYPHYIFDTSHGALEIREPFRSIYNSAQIWKFRDIARLRRVMQELGEEAQQGTNLVLINRYMQLACAAGTPPQQIMLPVWMNTNTAADFRALDFNA